MLFPLLTEEVLWVTLEIVPKTHYLRNAPSLCNVPHGRIFYYNLRELLR